MYELYRNRLTEHFHALNDNSNLNIKVRFEDTTDKTGMVVESLLTVYQVSPGNYDRLKYTINMYHTKTRIMVNGRQVKLFNDEHSKIADSIMASERVADLDKELLVCIDDGLRALSVENIKKQSYKQTNAQRHEPKILNDNVIQNNEATQQNTNVKHNKVNQNPQAGQKHTLGTNIEHEVEADQNEDFALCPVCRLAVDEGICCEKM